MKFQGPAAAGMATMIGAPMLMSKPKNTLLETNIVNKILG